MACAGEQAVHPTLVYGGTEYQERRGIRVLGWNLLDEIEVAQ
jgi:hypothetical protein